MEVRGANEDREMECRRRFLELEGGVSRATEPPADKSPTGSIF